MTWDFEGHYRDRCSQFRQTAQQAPAGGIVILGDSLTEGHPATTLAGLPVINQGISGDMLTRPDGGLLRRLDLVGLARPAHVFVLIGINDIIFGQRVVTDIERDLTTLIGDLPAHAPAAKIWVQSLLPTSGDHLPALAAVRRINAFLQGAREAAAEISRTILSPDRA